MSTQEICASTRLHRVPSHKIVCIFSTRMHRMTVRKMCTEPLCRFNGVRGIMAMHHRNALSHLRIHRITSKHTDVYGNALNFGNLTPQFSKIKQRPPTIDLRGPKASTKPLTLRRSSVAEADGVDFQPDLFPSGATPSPGLSTSMLDSFPSSSRSLVSVLA